MSVDYKDAVEAINAMAEVKMTMNRHKGDIHELHSTKLEELLRGEIAELSEAMERDNLMHVIEEVADVQNFLIAIVHQKIQEYRNRK